jgi:hypothetical protein
MSTVRILQTPVRVALTTGFLLLASYAWAASEWSDVNRIVAIGDVHGDYDQFLSLLQEAGLVNKRGKWTGDNATLVQTGDITDRGPDSRKIMDLLMKLEKSASSDGGSVHVLTGNHEVMNIRNDTRYVHAGEYDSFRDQNSRRRQDLYYEQTINFIRESKPEEEWPEFNNHYKDDWEKKYPLGYVEHRVAWAATGEYGKWVISHNSVIKINDTLFLHGGLSAAYAGMSLEEINTRARTELVDPKRLGEEALINADDGPFWYRGWASLPETPENELILDEVLSSQGVKRMVIGHTPLVPAVLPRFGGKILIIDVGLAAHYGGAFAALDITGDEISAIVRGARLDIPSGGKDEIIEYLSTAAALEPSPAKIESYIDTLMNPEPLKEEPLDTPAEDEAPGETSSTASQASGP